MARSEYLQLLRSRARWLVGGLVVGLLGAGLVTFLTMPSYAASVTFYITAPDPTGDLNKAYYGFQLAEKKAQTYLQLLNSERVRNDVGRRLGTPVGPEQITAGSQPDSVMLTATATDPSPERAQDIASTVGAVFTDLVVELEGGPGVPSPLLVEIIRTPELPTSPVSPLPNANLAFGAVLGLLGGWAGSVSQRRLAGVPPGATTFPAYMPPALPPVLRNHV